jgi:uncharacterized membrane protein YgcG
LKKFALALSTALLLGSLAAPAAAFVTDRQDLVRATDEQKLESALGRLGSHRFEVLFVERTSGAPSVLAKRTFNELRLGDKDGVIVVAVGAKQVGVHVGPGFTRRGVSDSVVSSRIKADFLPYAKKGEYARGAATLAKGLVDAGGRGTTSSTTSSRSRSSEPTDGDGVLGLLIILVIVGVPIGAGVMWLRAKGAGLKALQTRLDALRAPHEAIVSGIIKLAEIDEFARYQQGDVQKAYQQLGKGSQKTLKRARTFGDKFEAAEAAIKEKKTDDAKKQLLWLEREATTLGADVAATMTALEQLEAGGLSGEQAMVVAALPARVQGVSRRLADLKAMFQRECERAERFGLEPSPQVQSALEEAHERLHDSPVDPDGAERRLKEAEAAMDRFTVEVSQAEERHLEQERLDAEEARANADRAAWTGVAASSMSSHHHHHDSGSSANDSWGSDSGSSSNDSWGSDSGGSSSDDNW